MKWVCTVCGYVHEGDQPPAECPVCHVGADKFKKMEGDMTLAAEHEYGVYGKTVKNNAWLASHTEKAIRKSVFTGKKLLTKKQNTLRSSLNY